MEWSLLRCLLGCLRLAPDYREGAIVVKVSGVSGLILVLIFWGSAVTVAAEMPFRIPGGLLPAEPIIPDGVPAKYRDRLPLPGYWNWTDVRSVDWITPVKNQMGCGSCAAFAACGAVEAMMNLRAGNPDLDRDYSEQHLFSCSGGVCAEGLYMGDAFDYFRDYGVPDEDCFPYTASDQPCSNTCADWLNRVLRLDSWSLMWTWSPDIDTLKQAVWWQPIAVYMEVYADFSSYSGGIYKYDGTSAFRGGHFVVIVGWDDLNSCWICKNSWGTGWGEDGFFRINYGETSIGTWAMDPDWSDPVAIRDGDVDGNGMITAGDAQMAFQTVLGLIPLTAHESLRADCNGDNTLTAADAQGIFSKALGLGTCAGGEALNH